MPSPYSAPFSFVLLLSAAGLLSACGRDKPSVEVSPDGKTAYHTSSDGAEVSVAKDGESLDVADELPAFAPLYPGALVKTRLADAKDQGAKGGMWVLETADPVEKVAAFYDEQAKKAGVKPGMFVNEKDSAVRIFGNANDQSDTAQGALIAISHDEEDNLTKIVITAGTAISKRSRSADARESAALPVAPPRLQ